MSDGRDLVFGVMVGSLRKESLNRKVADNLAEHLPEGARLTELPSIGELPLYDEDLEAGGLPEPVERLAAAIRDTDAVLVVTPEYNYSMPGVLKNAIDWMTQSRPQPFAGKPTGIITASPSPYGGIRCQHQLRQVLVAVNAIVLPRPEVHIAKADEKLDAEGRLTDERAREFLGKMLEALADYARRFA